MKDIISVEEFMKVPDSLKGDFMNRYFHVEGGIGEDCDILVYHAKIEEGFECEVCDQIIEGPCIGTSDTREPFFHFECYQELNENSVFIPLDIWKKEQV